MELEKIFEMQRGLHIEKGQLIHIYGERGKILSATIRNEWGRIAQFRADQSSEPIIIRRVVDSKNARV